MLWEIDGFEVEILVQKRAGVQVVQWDEQVKKVFVQATLSKDEAIWCIRKLTSANVAARSDYGLGTLMLFDKNWPVKIQGHKIVPYIREGIIYASGSNLALNSRQAAGLQEILLQQHVMQCVSLWEERINTLIPAIAFRKFKTKPFSICLKKKLIVFDKSLHRLKIEVLEYGVFKAVSTYVKLEEKDCLTYKRQYFPSYKNYDKVLAYEYRFGDSD